MLIIIPIIVVALGLGIHMYRRKQDRNRAVFTEELTAWFLFAFVGLMGLLSFAGHAFAAGQTAGSIGFPAGNPFQFEVAVANLAFGVLGLLCLRYRGLFWWATGIGYAVFLWGAAWGHIDQIIVNNNHASGNAGFVLYTDIITPLVVFGLIIASDRMQKKQEPATKSDEPWLKRAA